MRSWHPRAQDGRRLTDRLRTYRWPIVGFVALQLVVVLLAPSPSTEWVVVIGYATAACLALATRAWLAAGAAASVTLVRLFLTMGVTGLPFRLASAAFAVLLFLLVISEIDRTR